MQNLKDLRTKKGVSQSEVGRFLGITQQAYANYERGEREPDNITLGRLADYYGVTTDYLLGRDEPLRSDDIISIADYEKYGLQPIKKHRVPLLGDIACGEPIFAEEQYGAYVDCDIEADFALTCHGDSMINARIKDGDLVFIRAQENVEHGEIAAIIIGDEATLKRVYYYPEQQKLILQAENSAYAPLVFVDSELDSIRILGKAVAFQSRL